MYKYIIFAQSDVEAAALNEARLHLRNNCADQNDDARLLVIPLDMMEASGSGIDLFNMCCDAVTAVVRSGGEFGKTVALVDSIRPRFLTAVAEGASWDHLVAMLILAFPEVTWIFGTVNEGDAGFPTSAHSFALLLQGREREMLFDPTGLRDWVRKQTIQNLQRTGIAGSESQWLPFRPLLAASIDDEKSYAYYHAYAAYRYGFRADAVTTWAQMTVLFGPAPSDSQRYALLMEDMRLNFPDKPIAVHLTDLADRSRHCPHLGVVADKALWRFLISTGQIHYDEAVLQTNKKQLESRRFGRGAVLWKPVGGIIDFWERAGLTNELGGGNRRKGNADCFEWPVVPSAEGDSSGHAAPGKLLMIADVLLRRAELISTGSVGGAILAAVYATDAVELSTGRTPTTTLTGLVLRQELEVRAECSFVGAGFHIGIKRRLLELDAELASVTAWYHEGMRQRAALDARVAALSRLVLIFRNAGKLEEETACLNDLRASNRELSRPQREIDRFPQIHSWIKHAFLGYAEWVLGSLDRLVLVCSLWLAGLTVVAWALGPSPRSLGNAAANAGAWFLGTSPLSTWSLLTPVSWVATALGILHLGILISYLYSLIARK